jgi:hypothetical protein
MSITHTLGKTWAGGAGSVGLQKTIAITSDAELNFDLAVPVSTTNELLAWAFTLTKLKSVYISSDNALTLKTNSSGSPQETLTLGAGDVIQWDNTNGLVAPFAGNVTALYVTNGSSTLIANLSIRTLFST